MQRIYSVYSFGLGIQVFCIEYVSNSRIIFVLAARKISDLIELIFKNLGVRINGLNSRDEKEDSIMLLFL